MSKAQIFKGTATALVTPFDSEGAVDVAALTRLIDRQLSAAIDGIVIAGSTGEAATLSLEEKLQLFKRAVRLVDGRTPIIAGTGSNSTVASIELSRAAVEAGVNAVLVVGPFYNRPTQEGYFQHFKKIAAAIPDTPVILYNVPSRTAGMIEAATQIRLAKECPNIVATKEASGDICVTMQIVSQAPRGFKVYAGDDILTPALIACGADGVIAVMSNVLPDEFSAAVRDCLDGKFAAGRQAFMRMLPLLQLAGIETNPIPVKEMLLQLKLIKPHLRLPLTNAEETTRRLISEELQSYGLL